MSETLKAWVLCHRNEEVRVWWIGTLLGPKLGAFDPGVGRTADPGQTKWTRPGAARALKRLRNNLS